MIEKEALIKGLIGALKKYQPEKAILFGSYARGDVREGSDIDILIIKDTEIRFIDRIEEAMNYLDEFPEAQPLVYTPDEIEKMTLQGNHFILSALEEGKVIYEKSEL